MAQAKVNTKSDYLAFAPIGGGSSWCRDTDILKAIAGVENQALKDWSHLFAFPDGLNIYIYDVTGCDDWYATHEGVFPVHADQPKAWTVVNGKRIEDEPKPLKRIARKVATYFDRQKGKAVKVEKPVLEYA